MKKLLVPVNSNGINDLKAGDIVNISGKILTARDQAHKRIIESGKEKTPCNLEGAAIFHAGPIISGDEDSGFEIIAIGPTTSTRMNPYEGELLKMGPKIIIGKGGMDEDVANALQKYGGVYLAAVGGCAALYVEAVKNIDNVHWLDLGIPEAIWELNVEEFGPLIVAMDSHGNNLYEKVE
ncbi:MAG: FumA C-terminus/TtdB family hydratase beta subunit [Methanobrevibacter sp.]|nr:FumA C-terminus/TtdB family hydratase beta subunit [Methanobrevibacter sp.]